MLCYSNAESYRAQNKQNKFWESSKRLKLTESQLYQHGATVLDALGGGKPGRVDFSKATMSPLLKQVRRTNPCTISTRFIEQCVLRPGCPTVASVDNQIKATLCYFFYGHCNYGTTSDEGGSGSSAFGLNGLGRYYIAGRSLSLCGAKLCCVLGRHYHCGCVPKASPSSLAGNAKCKDARKLMSLLVYRKVLSSHVCLWQWNVLSWESRVLVCILGLAWCRSVHNTYFWFCITLTPDSLIGHLAPLDDV